MEAGALCPRPEEWWEGTKSGLCGALRPPDLLHPWSPLLSPMPLPPPLTPAKARRHRKRRPAAATPAPPVVNQITSVAYGPAPEVLIVTVSGSLISVGELEGLLSVEILGNAYTPIDVNLESLPEVM